MADTPKITSPEELEAWLQDKPPDWAQVIALRAALRVAPLTGPPTAGVTGPVFRALLLSSTALEDQAYERRHAAHAARAAVRAAEDSTTYAARTTALTYVAAEAAADAARAAALAYVAANAAAEAAARAAANATRAARYVGVATLWYSISEDGIFLHRQQDPYKAAQALFLTPLSVDKSGKWLAELSKKPQNWSFWHDWYANIIEGGGLWPGDLPEDLSRALALEIAEKDENFWQDWLSPINAELTRLLNDKRRAAEARDAEEEAPIPEQPGGASFTGTEPPYEIADPSEPGDAEAIQVQHRILCEDLDSTIQRQHHLDLDALDALRVFRRELGSTAKPPNDVAWVALGIRSNKALKLCRAEIKNNKHLDKAANSLDALLDDMELYIVQSPRWRDYALNKLRPKLDPEHLEMLVTFTESTFEKMPELPGIYGSESRRLAATVKPTLRDDRGQPDADAVEIAHPSAFNGVIKPLNAFWISIRKQAGQDIAKRLSKAGVGALFDTVIPGLAQAVDEDMPVFGILLRRLKKAQAAEKGLARQEQPEEDETP